MNLEESYKELHLLSRNERTKVHNEILRQKPRFLDKLAPRWWWWSRCTTKVLIVCDGGLNFGTGGFDLSEFLTTFNELEARSFVDYDVTLAHRNTIVLSSNPIVVQHISNFKFDTSVDLSEFDEIWMFGISPSMNLTSSEVNEITGFMDGGGGVFATGDHGSLGRGMCGNIPRIKDMRYWDNFPAGGNNDVNEVSMGGKRRNDTNQPRPGNSIADTFDHQSDAYPQTIGVRTFGGGMPHPLLSISKAKRTSGIIDIMPDHPHEGECKPETSFTVDGITIPTQILATSFVPGGNTSGNKDGTVPHCFPSIAVWDGRSANAGRIVIDSTWHHFVNINLNGVGSAQSGLTDSDFDVIRQYYMNIATWMSRRRFFFCWRRWVVWELFHDSQLIEATLDNPDEKLADISLSNLKSIGMLAEQILESKYGSATSREILLELVAETNEALIETLDVWNPVKDTKNLNDSEKWFNYDLLLYTAIGSGFIALRDDKIINSEEPQENSLERIPKVFSKGANIGLKRSFKDFKSSSEKFESLFK